MKKTLSICILILYTVCFAFAQDTLYVFKTGQMVMKKAVNDVDSISFTYTPQRNGTVSDIDGNIYHWITIGNQIWMVENLKTSRFINGETISNITVPVFWSTATFATWCNYNNDPINGVIYGKLYNWYAVNDNRKIAPLGWHIPSNDEWTQLATILGGENIAGGKLKETGSIHWLGNNADATNERGFNALPAGTCNINGEFSNLGYNTYLWSSTLYDTDNVWQRGLVNSFSTLYANYSKKQNGFSVRCIKDNVASLSTNMVSAITSTTVVCGGNVTYDGGVLITSRGICWSLSSTPTISLYNKTVETGTTGLFISSITGLTPGTTFYIRAYATNSQGTAYGNQVIFTTSTN